MSNDATSVGKADDGTIVIMSNRGPHDFVWENERWIARAATGGLMGMVESLARQPNVAWFCCVSEPPGSEAKRDGLYTTAKDQIDPDLNVVPVPLPAGIYQEYYGEISNGVLWMLQHHLVGQFGSTVLDSRRHLAWKSYLEASRRMADAVLATEIPVRAFLIHDYHLYPLAALLRKSFPSATSLHFVHLPFPAPAVLKLLPRPWRETILRGLLGADVVGLQTAADVRSFLACCEEILQLPVNYEHGTVMATAERDVRVRAFPASVDPDAIHALQAASEVEAARGRLAGESRAMNIIRVDRLDPAKNQIFGFSAFARMLELNPQLCGKVRFLAFLVPSRTDTTIYADYYHAVLREVEAVNARFRAACGFDPIKVFYANDRPQAFAAMEMCDVLLVNSRHDGVNLTVKEWALLAKKPGVLVLSETTGVAAECAESALLVSPLDVEGTANALAEALAMPQEQRAARVEQLRQGIRRWKASDWLEAQLDELGLNLPARPAPPLEVGEPPSKRGVVECELTVCNREGIHARPAAAFVRCAREFKCSLEIVKGSETFSAKSILAVLTANLNRGSTFTLRATGPDAPEAARQLGDLLASLKDEDR